MFAKMAEIIPEGEFGSAKVKHFRVDEFESRMSAFRRGGYVPEGQYARLTVDRTLVMSDTPMEHATNYKFAFKAHGKVLVAGLGLGMVLTAILEKPSVESVTVVEISQDVVNLISPHFPSPKLSIITADIFDWRPEKGIKFNVIYFDIWPDVCVDNIAEIAKLHRAFARRLDRADPKAWMHSWQYDTLKSHRRAEQWRGY